MAMLSTSSPQSTQTPISVAVIGSTTRTLHCLKALRNDPRYVIPWILTPAPRLIGRTKELQRNPLHEYAHQHQIETKLVEQTLTPNLTQEILEQVQKPDLLLVVDFGYLIPELLLGFNRFGAVNVHPSKLPRWRGSSPGQFVLLTGETDSAITIMLMDAGLDTGPILIQLPLSVDPSWTQTEYYQASFELAGQALPTCLFQLVQGEIIPQPQPIESPTPIARRLNKTDSYVDWTTLITCMPGIGAPSDPNTARPADVPLATSDLLTHLAADTPWSIVLARAARAFSPWPGLWTLVPTRKGWKRCKLLAVTATESRLTLDRVQIEGLQPTTWAEIANQIV